MSPLALGAIALLLTKGFKGNGGAGGWRQLAPSSKGQYLVPTGAKFVIDIVRSSPVAALLTKQISDLGGQILPPQSVATLPIDWPADDDMRTAPDRMRGVAVAMKPTAIDMGTSPNPTRVWVQ